MHIAGATLVLLIPVSLGTSTVHRAQSVTILTAPRLQPYRGPAVRPRIALSRRFIAPPPVQRRLSQTPPPPAPVIEARQMAPKPAILPAVPQIQPAAAPAPRIETGMLEARASNPAPAPPRALKTGVFGDAMGARPSLASTSSPLPRVGSFEGSSGGDSRNRSGSPRAVVADAGFGGSGADPHSHGGGSARVLMADAGFGEGSAGGPGGSAGGRGGSVRSAGFGDIAAGSGSSSRAREAAAPPTTPVRILYKPKPVYTAEARALKIQGEVLLEVVFRASGTVQVQRVVRGLGHQLDDAAEQAAMGIRFRPATRGGIPVDTRATVNITFELT